MWNGYEPMIAQARLTRRTMDLSRYLAAEYGRGTSVAFLASRSHGPHSHHHRRFLVSLASVLGLAPRAASAKAVGQDVHGQGHVPPVQ